jgi:Brp/Blh family beta-carotene 15,15'-monooxygenase
MTAPAPDTGPPPLSTTARRTLARLVFRPAWGTLAAVTVAFGALRWADVTLPPVARYAPLAASVLLLGLPHGAVDHLAPARVRGDRPTPRSMLWVGGLYAVLMAAYAAVWVVAPAAAFVGFVLVTWGHWGQGELYPLLRIAPVHHIDTRPGRVLTAATRGALPMCVPLVAFPDAYRRVAGLLVAPFAAGPGAETALDALVDPAVRAAVAAGVGLLVATTLAYGHRRVRRSGEGADARHGWRLDAAETLLLVGFFAVVPPVFGIGLYFCVWHSLRHVARLSAITPDGRAALDEGAIGAALAAFGRDAAPLTAASLGLLAGAFLLVPRPPSGPRGLIGLYLVLIALLTVPHTVVVGLMDREQGIWTPRSSVSGTG